MATLTSGFIILYVGALLDRISLRKFTYFTSAGLALGCILMGLSQSLWMLVAGLFLLRFCGQGLMFHISFTSMARYFDQNRGKAIGIVGFGMPLGEAVLPTIAFALIAGIGWQQSWLALAALIAIVYWPFMHYLLARSKERLTRIEAEQLQSKSSGQTEKSWTRAQVVRDIKFWMLLPAIMAPAFIVTGILIHQDVLLSTKNWSEEWFTICFYALAIAHLKASLITGSLVDRYSGKKLVRIYLFPLLLAVGLLALPLDHAVLAMLAMLFLGLSIGAGGPVIGSLWVEVYGSANLGAIRSLVTSIMVFSTAISPVLFGWLFDSKFAYSSVMEMLIIYILASSTLVWVALKK